MCLKIKRWIKCCPSRFCNAIIKTRKANSFPNKNCFAAKIYPKTETCKENNDSCWLCSAVMAAWYFAAFFYTLTRFIFPRKKVTWSMALNFQSLKKMGKNWRDFENCLLLQCKALTGAAQLCSTHCKIAAKLKKSFLNWYLYAIWREKPKSCQSS